MLREGALGDSHWVCGGTRRSPAACDLDSPSCPKFQSLPFLLCKGRWCSQVRLPGGLWGAGGRLLHLPSLPMMPIRGPLELFN